MYRGFKSLTLRNKRLVKIMSKRRKKIVVSIAERPFLIGNDELMGWLGVDSEETLKKNYLLRGLHPVQRGRKIYYYKDRIDRFLIENDEFIEANK